MRTARWLMLSCLLAASLALGAGKRPTEFKEPRQLTDEELALAKQQSRSNIHEFDEKMQEKPKDPPYMLIGLCVLALLSAAPFAARAYRRTSKDIAGGDSAYAGDGAAEE